MNFYSGQCAEVQCLVGTGTAGQCQAVASLGQVYTHGRFIESAAVWTF